MREIEHNSADLHRKNRFGHSAYDRFVLVGVDLLFALFNYTKSQIQSMYLTQTHPVLTVPISHFFSELLVFGYAIAKSIH